MFQEFEHPHDIPFGLFTQRVRERETTMLTFGVVADTDIRFTRESYVAFQFLLGIAFVDQDDLPTRTP